MVCALSVSDEAFCCWNLHAPSSAGCLTGNLPPLSAAIIPILNLALIFSLIAALWFLLKPVLIQKHESKSYKYELMRLKNNREIFESILSKQTSVSGTEGLGTTIR